MTNEKMTAARRAGAWVSACLVFGIAAVSAHGATADDARRQTAENSLRPRVEIEGDAPMRWNVYQRMRRYRVPTMSVAVIEHGRIIWSARYRSDGTMRMPAGDERYQAASLSKGFAGNLAAILADKGVVKLDEPVDGCLAPLALPAGKQNAAHPVTLRNLLHHTAGATVHGFPGYVVGTSVPTAEQVVLGQPPSNTPAVKIATVPGATFDYSGGGYTFAQIAMAHCAKAPFASLMQRYVLGPAGMRDSTFAQPLPAGLAHATGHTSNGDPVPGDAHTYPELAAAGLWTTAEDLARWLIALRNADMGKSSFLSRKAAKDLLTPGLGNYGMGIFVSGEGAHRRFMHEGGNAGFKSKYVMFAEQGNGVVILTDGDNGVFLMNEFAKAVAVAYGWTDLDPRIVPRARADETAMAKRVGQYVVDDPDWEGERSMSLVREGDRWYLDTAGLGHTALVPTGAQSFVAPDTGYPIVFDDKDGLTSGPMKARKVR